MTNTYSATKKSRYQMTGFCRVWLGAAAVLSLTGCIVTQNPIDVATREAAGVSRGKLDTAQSASVDMRGPVSAVISSGLAKQETLFEGRSTLIEAMLLRQAKDWSYLPVLVPGISVDDSGAAVGQVNADLTLLDWGKSGGEKQTLDAQLLRAKIVFWEERNTFVDDVLQDLVKMAAAQARIDVIKKHLVINERLQNQVESRVVAGIGEAAELPLVALRVHELQRYLAVEMSQKTAAQLSLVEKTGVAQKEVPTLSLPSFLRELQPPNVEAPPSLQRARCDVLIADGNIRTALANRLPSVVLTGVAAVLGSSTSSVTVGVGSKSVTDIVLQTDTKVARVRAISAMSRLKSEEDAVEQKSTIFALRNQEVLTRIKALSEQIDVSERAIETFDRQFEIGSRPITDAVQVNERLFEAERLLVEAHQEAALLGIARLAALGALAPQPKIILENTFIE